MNKIKRIPYGKSDFEATNSQNDYYVDKTMFLPELEKTPYVFLIRPRRFGKSLLVSTLQTYYDIAKKDRFNEFFSNTWINENPTDERAKYLVLYFNFSAILKEKEKVQEDFNKYCVLEIDAFIQNYTDYIPLELIRDVNEKQTAHEKLHVLSIGLRKNDYKIYLLIDEYDNFTNTLLTDFGEQEYKRITRQAGYFKQFFTNLKLLTSGSGSGLARIFITGVSPVTMDDVTSGFNIGNNISNSLPFNQILGFTEEDVKAILDYYEAVGELKINKSEALGVMTEWYNHYIFSLDANQSVYNSDAVWYFIKEAIYSQSIPKNLIDDNLRMDYGKLRYLVMKDKQLNGNFSRLSDIIETGGILTKLKTSFPFDMLTQPENFVSLLYYFGLITFSGKTIKGRPYLSIPNEAMKTILCEYVRESLRLSFNFTMDVITLEDNISAMAFDGEFKTAFKFIESEIQRQSSIRDFIDKENIVKIFYLVYLNIYDLYIAVSEKEKNKGYADIVLEPFLAKYPDIEYAYLLEFKYIPRSIKDKELEKEVAFKIAEAEKQLSQYANDETARKMLGMEPYGNVKLKKLIIVFHGWELAYCEEV